MSYHKKLRQKSLLGAGLFCLLLPAVALAGGYLLSAHGSTTAGVARPTMISAGYGQGNCAHCHEMHASLGGVEPAPAGGAPSPYAVFAQNFDTTFTANPYLQGSDFCFYCHNSTGSVQQVTNQDYSATFGNGDSTGPQSIMAAFNQASYHNLADIKTFLSNNSSTYPWFSSSYSNPCNGCHNPHLAKRNWYSGLTGFPLNSAISKPTGHFSLWGESQLMSAYTNSYDAPYVTYQSTYSTSYREPAGVGAANGSKTPDYSGFCTDCHTSTATIYSTTLGRNLKMIDWTSAGDVHGGFARYSSAISNRDPYAHDAATSNFVLSCLDCHEPHGSPNIMLLRRRINGENLEGNITTTNVMGYVCRRCHLDDKGAAAGTNTLNKWQYVHHLASYHPYTPNQCGFCHGSGGPTPPPIPCGNCHGHGMTDSWAGSRATGNKAF
ncbi:MAG: hypothetical protein ACYC2W_00740 [Desulfurivibrionaceae bacterium]